MFAFAIFALASWLQPKNFEPARQTPVLHDGRRQRWALVVDDPAVQGVDIQRGCCH